MGNLIAPILTGTEHGDQEGNRLIEMAEDSFLSQLVTQPTRGNNMLDLVLTTDTDLISDCEVGEILSGCDHHMIGFRSRTKHQLTEIKSKVPDNRNANFDFARELLLSEIVGIGKSYISSSRMEHLQR